MNNGVVLPVRGFGGPKRVSWAAMARGRPPRCARVWSRALKGCTVTGQRRRRSGMARIRVKSLRTVVGVDDEQLQVSKPQTSELPRTRPVSSRCGVASNIQVTKSLLHASAGCAKPCADM